MQLKQIPSMHTSFVYMSIITLQVLLRCYTTRLHYGKYFICLPKRKKEEKEDHVDSQSYT